MRDRLHVNFHWLFNWGTAILNRNKNNTQKIFHLGNVPRAFLSPQMLCRCLREGIQPDLDTSFETITSRQIGHIVKDRLVSAGIPKEEAERFALDLLHETLTKSKKEKASKAGKNTDEDTNQDTSHDPLVMESVKISRKVYEEIISCADRRIAKKEPEFGRIKEALEHDKCLGGVLWGRLSAGHPEYKIVRASHVLGCIGVTPCVEPDLDDYVSKDDLLARGDQGAAFIGRRERCGHLGYCWVGIDIMHALERYSKKEMITILNLMLDWIAIPYIRGRDYAVPFGIVEIGHRMMPWDLAFQPPVMDENVVDASVERLRKECRKLWKAYPTLYPFEICEFGTSASTSIDDAHNFIQEKIGD